MRQLLFSVRDAVRTQLWPVPVLAVVLAALVGVLLPRLDAVADASMPAWLAAVLFGGDADAARTVLSAVSSSLITVTSLTFSLTVVTLQLASSQFSPRLLRTFTSDIFVQATLGLFLATFTYSLTVLRSVRNGSDGQIPFVPRISVTTSFGLAVASVIGLVVFLAHLARQIRVETMLRDVHRDSSAVVDAVLSARRDPALRADLPTIPDRADVVLAAGSGFVLRLDEGELLAAAIDANAVLIIGAHPGASLVQDTPLGHAWSPDGPFPSEVWDRLHGRVARAVRTGYERTSAQDVGYGLRQLTDVANKALSPGINDPTTAVHALGHISALLCELGDRDLQPVVLHDDVGHVRAILQRPGLGELVDTALTQPRRYGAADPAVMGRMFDLLGELAWRFPPEEHPVVRSQLARLRSTVAAQDFDAEETRQLRNRAALVESRLRIPHVPVMAKDLGPPPSPPGQHDPSPPAPSTCRAENETGT
ncbi:putative membrane protein [Nakamurella sp. UYEF19]|uniref:DUF2254 domain-containing protein n=1 Tax=Nakamurella sp. UYEF19 TaxID=1756392 RepID=UPI0033943F58